jgi:hypothetical protein
MLTAEGERKSPGMDVGDIANYGTIAMWILAGFKWIGQRLEPSAKPNMIRAWITSPRLTGILILIGLGMSSLQWYLHRDYSDLKYDSTTPLEVVADKYFTNQTVEVDGKDFRDCHFQNVTLLFHGRKHFGLAHSGIGNINLASDNSAVLSSWVLAKGLGFLQGIPLLGSDGKPVPLAEEPGARMR